MHMSGNIDAWPSVSVVIVTKGNHQEAERAVASVLAADYPEELREVVVVEEVADPAPIEGAGIKYIAIPERNLGLGSARNQGLSNAAGEIIVFTDDDCVVDRNWLKELVRPLLKDKDAQALCGAVHVPACGPVGRCENILGFPGGGVKYVRQAKGEIITRPTFSTCNCAIRRNVVDAGLSFHEDCRAGGEDELFSRKISAEHPILYNPEAEVMHKPRDSFAAVFFWFVRRGQARVEMMRHGSKGRFVLGMLYTSQIIRLLVIIGICLAFSMPLLPVLAVIFELYYLSVILRHVWAWKYHPSVFAFVLLPFVKAAMDIGMDLGVVKTVLTRMFRR
jgi:GT2 family glycosyltransferase